MPKSLQDLTASANHDRDELDDERQLRQFRKDLNEDRQGEAARWGAPEVRTRRDAAYLGMNRRNTTTLSLHQGVLFLARPAEISLASSSPRLFILF